MSTFTELVEQAVKKLDNALAPVRPQLIKARSAVQDIGGASLKGNKGSAADFYKQLAGKQGVKKNQLEQAYGHLKDSPIIMTRDQFLGAGKRPQLAVQKAFQRSQTADPHELAHDYFWATPELGPAAERRLMHEIMAGHPQFADISMADRDRIINQDIYHTIINGDDEVDAYDFLRDNTIDDIFETPEMNQAYNYATERVSRKGGTPEINVYSGFQRQPHGADSTYFETTLRTAPREGRQTGLSTYLNRNAAHFSNPGQIAHARGNIQPGASSMFKPAVNVEELQSDALEEMGKSFPRAYPHADMAKALLLQSAKGDAGALTIPTAESIASVRGSRYLPFYQSVYDDELFKQFYKPLDTLGIPTIETGPGRALMLTDEVKDALNKTGLPFKKGGLVQMAEGGEVPHPVADFLGFTSPATVVPGLAQLAEWAYMGAGKAVPRLITKGAGLPFALMSGLAGYSVDTATDAQEMAGLKAGREALAELRNGNIEPDEYDTWQHNRYAEILAQQAAEAEAADSARRTKKLENLKKNTPNFHFAKGGLVPAKNDIMTGGLGLVHPKSKTRGPLNISMNMNNMLARARNG